MRVSKKYINVILKKYIIINIPFIYVFKKYLSQNNHIWLFYTKFKNKRKNTKSFLLMIDVIDCHKYKAKK